MSEPTRREFLQRAGAAAGAAWLTASWPDLMSAQAHAKAVATGQQPPALAVLTPAEAAVVEAVSERIFPADDLPGARALGVVHFIDRSLTTFAKAELPALRQGLAELAATVRARHPRAESFAALTSAEQDAILHQIERTPFFGRLREATMVGCFARPEYGGNRNGAGWAMIGFEERARWEPPFGYYDRDDVRARILPPVTR